MSARSRERGFTLVEVIVVVAVIAILAAILTPYITKYIEDSRTAKARNEVQVIGSAMANFYKDVGRWPYANNAAANPATNFNGVYSGAAAPTAAFFGAAAGWPAVGAANWNGLDTHLFTNGHNYTAAGDLRWNGPYATQLPTDPWGHPYVINAVQFVQAPPPAAQIPVWVMSAGPNGVIDTNIAAGTITPTLDDIGFRIR
jgi:prepilin-type N-terminal cleavage/methylation domain-containing protein